MGAIFVLGAAVQLNDPDPFRWIVIYLGAAVVSFVAPFRADPTRHVAVGVGVLAGCWGALIAAQGLGPITMAELVSDVTMKTPNVEAWRESLGLFLIAGWCISVWFTAKPPPDA